MFKAVCFIFFASFFLLACNNKTEDKISQLEEKLKKLTDPEKILEAQTKLKLDFLMDKLSKLEDQLNTTTNKASCEKIWKQVIQHRKKIEEFREENLENMGGIMFGMRYHDLGCKEAGYNK